MHGFTYTLAQYYDIPFNESEEVTETNFYNDLDRKMAATST